MCLVPVTSQACVGSKSTKRGETLDFAALSLVLVDCYLLPLLVCNLLKHLLFIDLLRLYCHFITRRLQ